VGLMRVPQTPYPPGTYTWFAALTPPGTVNIIGTLAVAPFSFGP